jgi:hypothetical protein
MTGYSTYGPPVLSFSVSEIACVAFRGSGWGMPSHLTWPVSHLATTGVLVGVFVDVSVGVFVGVSVGVFVDVLVGVFVGVLVAVGV